MPRLLLVRHATSVRPTPGGPSERDRPLSELGVQQAQDLVEVLAPQRPVRVLSSPYRRAVQTVQPTAAALGVAVELREELREWRSGLGATLDWEQHYRRCWAHPDWALPGGETHDQLQERALAAVLQVAAELPPDAVAVLGSHGTWIARALRGLEADVDADSWLRMPMPAVVEVDVTDRAATVRP